jgi:ubiquinone/menaquinone biosynthesis C-methylase UbiE
MLDVAAARLEKSGLENWRVQVADHRHLPAVDRCADLAISGWSVCYTVVDHPDTWRDELGKALAEMERVLRPGGTIVILETLGTGHATPHPPDNLAAYYAFLERERGFSHAWIRTDYRFESLSEAETLLGFFFGESFVESMAEKLLSHDPVVFPECTGIWYLQI